VKEMPVILVDRVVDKKRIIGKMEGRGGGEAQGVDDPPPPKKKSDKSAMRLNCLPYDNKWTSLSALAFFDMVKVDVAT
jgi:hypothetical protein